jgi:hypothetical protein
VQVVDAIYAKVEDKYLLKSFFSSHHIPQKYVEPLFKYNELALFYVDEVFATDDGPQRDQLTTALRLLTLQQLEELLGGVSLTNFNTAVAFYGELFKQWDTEKRGVIERFFENQTWYRRDQYFEKSLLTRSFETLQKMSKDTESEAIKAAIDHAITVKMSYRG